MPRVEGIWPDDHTAFLRECMEGGMTESECAAAINTKFGTGYSRNAICGKAWRSKATYVKPKKKPKSEKRSEPPKVIVVRPKPKPLLVDTVTGFRCADVEPLHLSLIELRANQCHWPYGEENFTFCGHPTLDGDSYCVEHRQLATPILQQKKVS